MKNLETPVEIPVRLVEVLVRDVLRIRTAAIHPHGTIVPVKGKNGQGKTSLLTCIQMALGGKKHFPAKPVRDGAKTGTIEIDLEGYTLKWKINEDGSASPSLVEKSTGRVITRVQEFIDRLWSSIALDPLKFSRMVPKEQAATLMRLVGLDFTKADELRKEIFERRTLVNRDIGSKEALILQCPIVPAGTPEELTNITEAMQKVVDLRAAKSKWNMAEHQDKRATDDIDRLAAELKQAHERRAEARKILDQAKPFDKEIAIAEQALQGAEATNKAVESRKLRVRLGTEKLTLETTAQKMTEDIEKIDRRKVELLSKAKMPLPGMTVDQEGVYLGGVPFAQASQAEKIRAGVALGLADNPRLRLIRIEDGSLLDEDSMQALREEAEARDAMVLIERIDTDMPGGVLVVDGVATDDTRKAGA